MSDKEFEEELNKRFIYLAYLFQQLNQNKNDNQIHTNFNVCLNDTIVLIREHSSFIKNLSKEKLNIVNTLLSMTESKKHIRANLKLFTDLEQQVKGYVMDEKAFMKELNRRFNEFATIFQQVNQNNEDVELRTNALINLSCFSHFVIEHSSFIKDLPKENLSMVYTLLNIAKSEDLSSAFELGTILEAQGISR